MAKQNTAWMVVLLACACTGEVDNRAFDARNGGLRAPLPESSGGSAGSAGEPDAGTPSEPVPEGNPGASQAEPPTLLDPDAPPICTSDSFYVNTEEQDEDAEADEYEVEGSPRMHPGRACVSCHDQFKGPEFVIGGTLYPSLHEPDDCESTSVGDAQVVITDATGREIVLEVNDVGSFHSDEDSEDGIAFPIRAKIVQGGRERVMFGERMTGDCNSCHTQDGLNGAPGRIVLP